MLRGVRCREADALQQILETGLAAQIVHGWIYVQIDEPVRMLFVGLLEAIEGKLSGQSLPPTAL